MNDQSRDDDPGLDAAYNYDAGSEQEAALRGQQQQPTASDEGAAAPAATDAPARPPWKIIAAAAVVLTVVALAVGLTLYFVLNRSNNNNKPPEPPKPVPPGPSPPPGPKPEPKPEPKPKPEPGPTPIPVPVVTCGSSTFDDFYSASGGDARELTEAARARFVCNQERNEWCAGRYCFRYAPLVNGTAAYCLAPADGRITTCPAHRCRAGACETGPGNTRVTLYLFIGSCVLAGLALALVLLGYWRRRSPSTQRQVMHSGPPIRVRMTSIGPAQYTLLSWWQKLVHRITGKPLPESEKHEEERRL